MEAVIERILRCSIILVGGAPRSGTTLLMQLLDGHPKIVGFPAEISFLDFFWRVPEKERKSFLLKYLPQATSEGQCFRTSIRERCIKRKQRELGLAFDGEGDPQAFSRIFDEQMAKCDVGVEWVLRALAVAFVCSSPVTRAICDEPEILIFKKPYTVELYAKRIAAESDSVGFVQLVRDPIGRFVSAKRRASLRVKSEKSLPRISTDPVFHHSAVTFSSQYLSLENRAIIRNYSVVRYEELCEKPTATISKICQQLGIGVCKSLVMPSHNGRPVRANSSFWREEEWEEGRIVSAKDVLSRRLASMTNESERTYLEYLSSAGNLYPAYQFWEVGQREARRAWRRRFRFERHRDYIRRLILGYGGRWEKDAIRKRLVKDFLDSVRSRRLKLL